MGGSRGPFLGAPRQDTDLLGATVSRALRHRAMQVAMAPFLYFSSSQTFMFNCAPTGLAAFSSCLSLLLAIK